MPIQQCIEYKAYNTMHIKQCIDYNALYSMHIIQIIEFNAYDKQQDRSNIYRSLVAIFLKMCLPYIVKIKIFII